MTTETTAPSASRDIVLAFSGGLDTSFCVPYLKERGWNVHTVFADTGGVDAEERAFIEARAKSLIHASMSVPPQELSMMPMGTFNLRCSSRAKK